MKVDDAIGLATRLHRDRVDKAGRPYMEHVLRVVAGVDSDEEKMTAALHDVMEDEDLRTTDLHAAGVPTRVVFAVASMTRGPDEHYEEYLMRVAADPIAARVKAADLADNSDEARLGVLPDDVAARLRAKYAEGKELLAGFRAHAAPPTPEREGHIAMGEIGSLEGEPDLSATFWCSVCHRPAATVELLGNALAVKSFMGCDSQRLSDENREKVERAARDGDVEVLWDLHLTDFWCVSCKAVYCGHHWEVTPQYADDHPNWLEAMIGVCPAGHRHMLWD